MSLHPRPSLLRQSVETKDIVILRELVPLVEESAAAIEAGDFEVAKALLDTVLCAIDPEQGHKYREWLAQRDASRSAASQSEGGNQ